MHDVICEGQAACENICTHKKTCRSIRASFTAPRQQYYMFIIYKLYVLFYYNSFNFASLFEQNVKINSAAVNIIMTLLLL